MADFITFTTTASALLGVELSVTDILDAEVILSDDEKNMINAHITEKTADGWAAYIRVRLAAFVKTGV
jgi:hypothetical protein